MPRFVDKILQSKLVERQKFGLIFFQAYLIYGDQEPLWVLNVIEDDYQFLGVHMFANYFSLKSSSLSLKSHINVLYS